MEIHLLAEPARLSMAERDRFRVGIVATNTTAAAVDPNLYAAHLLVNGERSTAFDLAIGNGVVPATWDVLPADQATPAVEDPLGEALFAEPGEYELELVLDPTAGDGAQTTRTVTVTP